LDSFEFYKINYKMKAYLARSYSLNEEKIYIIRKFKQIKFKESFKMFEE